MCYCKNYSFLPRTIILWNSLPSHITSARTINLFKDAVFTCTNTTKVLNLYYHYNMKKSLFLFTFIDVIFIYLFLSMIRMYRLYIIYIYIYIYFSIFVTLNSMKKRTQILTNTSKLNVVPHNLINVFYSQVETNCK